MVSDGTESINFNIILVDNTDIFVSHITCENLKKKINEYRKSIQNAQNFTWD